MRVPCAAYNQQGLQFICSTKTAKIDGAVETIKAERDVIESELRSATVNLKEQFLSALAADGAINEPAISLAEIGKTIAPLQNQVQDNLSRQETLIQDIKQAQQEFAAESGSTNQSSDTMLTQLATAYDVFSELQHNLQDGVKFYNDLTQLLITFQNKISDYCFARKTEKDELLKDLTQQASRQAQPPTPSIPAHLVSTTPAASRIAIFISFGTGTNICNAYSVSNATPGNAGALWSNCQCSISSVCTTSDASRIQSLRHTPISKCLSRVPASSGLLWNLSWRIRESTGTATTNAESE
ncbi:programmed cell death 6-interacting protein-like [Aedes aegypti]|uniref:ALIX V-shaped domain-containing protein n=1 Tax=Aedes aegypti TaxID=7159 RepID=A0A903VR05_AEDAE|nr:programmed cell death 6-interacting protein-like [Aedes aegypti]